MPNGVTTNYAYDNANRLLNLEYLNSLNQILETIGYTYDMNGNRTSMNRPSVTLPMPNAVTNTSYNGANQMLSFNDKNITYDNNGNMTSVTNACGITNYTWDARNRLVGINGFTVNCSPFTANFKYDALGRRIEKTINGQTTKYLYDGLDIIQELNQDGSLKANYIRGLNIDEPLLRSTQNAVRLYLTDALGSVIALTDENGVIKTTYSYDSFGAVTITGEASDNPFQYAGRENDGAGHLFERNRYYNFELMRYISEDQIRLAGGDINYFVRVGNNPVNFVDPLGLAVLNPNNYPISPAVQQALQNFNNSIGQNHDVVVTGGDRPASSNLGAGSNSTHVQGIAADIYVLGQTHLQTANQAAESGLFGGVGWYEEGYRGPHGEGPHVHIDLRTGNARWGFSKTGKEYHGYFPKYGGNCK